MKKPKKGTVPEKAEKKKILWYDRRRIIFGLPWTFTKYSITEEKFLLKEGLIKTTEDEVRLYRILDVTLSRNLEEKIFGLGTLCVRSSDKSLGNFKIKRIKKPKDVRCLLSDAVEKARRERGIAGREFLGEDITDSV